MNFVIMVDIPDPNTDSEKIMTSIFVKWIKGAEKEKYLQVKVSSRNRHGSSQPSATITITTQRSGCMLFFYDYYNVDHHHHIVINWVLDSDRSRHTADGENNRGLCLCLICWYWWYFRCRCSLFILILIVTMTLFYQWENNMPDENHLLDKTWGHFFSSFSPPSPKPILVLQILLLLKVINMLKEMLMVISMPVLIKM